ncbi:hypothetical protein UFOVP217_32 [uncultured Caudovirales phage]|uniref:Uncharacterized protein n=1 Tax=uncultured Caudovirales phage TaxID=2100421 RepID=A0A6J7WPC0_9CAUD|nr:hypothetical protein UFOVP217_32 [uncultured Caudovirales phage]
MKYILIVLFCLISSIVFGQYTPMSGAGYQYKRIKVDSTMHLPSFCGIPTLRGSIAKDGALAIDTCANLLYKYTNQDGWSAVGDIDTTSLSNRIDLKVNISDTADMLIPYAKTSVVNLKLNISDTAAMLNKYLRKVDTASLSNRINLKLNISDTTSMLSKYLRKVDTASLSNRINLKLNISDTASMLSKYLRKVDTASLSSRINLKLNISDTTSMLSKYLRKIDTTNKWVTSVTKVNDSTIRVVKGSSTTDLLIRGSGGSGGGGSTDTTSLSNRINLKVNISDTASMLSPYLTGIDTASLSSRINLKVNISDTASMLSPYLTGIDTTSLSNRINLKVNISDTSSMLSPYLTGIDTASLSSRINLKVNITDTASMLLPYLKKIDTASLSSRINLKVNITDTASMLSKYLRIVDTANKWVSSVTKVNDSTIRVIKDGTTTDITLTSSTTVTNATRLITTVYNNTGSTITKGSVVYISGRHSSNLPTIALAQANNEATSYKTFAIVESDITTSNSGIVIQAGNIGNLNLPTSSYTDGDIVYLSPTVAGGLTTTKPLASNHICKIGSVTRAHPTFGQIEVKIENGWQMDELSDVQIALTPNDSTLLQFSRVDSLWHAVSVNNAIGTKYIKPSDTASMLTNYIRSANYGLSKSGQTISADTTKLSTLYQTNLKLNATDTASLSSRIDNLTQDVSLIAMQAMGSTIKGYNLSCPIISQIINTTLLVSGNVLMNAIYLEKPTTITGVKFFQSAQGVFTASNYNGVGLYSVSGGTLTLVASTTNDGNIWKNTSNTWQAKPFTTPYTAPAGIYYIATMFSSSATTTTPSLGIGPASLNTTALKAFDFTNGLKISQFISGQTSLPSTITSSSTTFASGNYGFYLY